MADRLRHARALLRARRASVSRARRARHRPDRARARHVSARADSALRSDGDDRRAAARAGAAPVPAAARHPRRLRALQHVQLVRVQGAREERSRRLLRAPRDRAAERRPVDQRVRAAAAHESGRRQGRRGGGRTSTARRFASRPRSSSCRAARSTPRRCCCDRRTTGIRTGSRTRRGSSGAATWRTWRR